MNEKTRRRWMAGDEQFKRELSEVRRTMFQTGMNRVQALTAVAIDKAYAPRYAMTVAIARKDSEFVLSAP